MFDACPKSADSSMKYKKNVSVSVLAAVVILVVVSVNVYKASTPIPSTPIQPDESDLNDMYVQYRLDDINRGVVRLRSVVATDKSPMYGYVELLSRQNSKSSRTEVINSNTYYKQPTNHNED